MPRLLINAQRGFPIAIVITLAIALLPAGALGWVRPLAEIARLVFMPFAEVGNAVAFWIRPLPSTIDGDLNPESLLHYKQQMVEFERLYLVEQARADELERRLEQLQNAPSDMPTYPVKPVLARIGPRSPFDAHGSVALNRGAKDGIATGTIAVHDHVHVVGWVTEATHVNCTLTPLASEATRGVVGAVLPLDRGGGAVTLDNAPRIALEGRANGTLVAQPDSALLIHVGDEVVLLDNDWPRAAQAMRIGTVESVHPSDKNPLRNIVVVRPKYQLSDIRMVVLRVDMEEDLAAAGGGR